MTSLKPVFPERFALPGGLIGVWALAMGVAGGCSALAAAPGGITLVDHGRPAAVIVLPDNVSAESAESQAANVLQAHLRQMSGATLDIKRERDLGNIQVEQGRLVLAKATGAAPEVLAVAQLGNENVPSEQIPQAVRVPAPATENFVLIGTMNLTKRLEVETEGVGVGGIRLKTTGNAVVLLGGPAGLPRILTGGLSFFDKGLILLQAGRGTAEVIPTRCRRAAQALQDGFRAALGDAPVKRASGQWGSAPWPASA